MKKFFIVFALLMMGAQVGLAQNIDHSKAMGLLSKNKETLGLSQTDIDNSIISNAYLSNSSGITYVYVQQAYKGLPVFNQVSSFGFRGGIPVSTAYRMIADPESKSKNISIIPGIKAETAVLKALESKGIINHEILLPSTVIPGKKFDFGKAGVAQKNITAELMWLATGNPQQLDLVWQIELLPQTTSDYWLIRVNANDNHIVDENNLTVSCNWNGNQNLNPSGNFVNWSDGKTTKSDNRNEEKHLEGIFAPYSPNLISNATYRVVPHPYESPKHCQTTTALVSNPWNAAPGNATSLKWHSTGASDYIYTRGNNVWAQEDANGNNGTGIAATSTTAADPLSFDFMPDFNFAPGQTTPTPNQQFNTTNLFYWNNILHDVMYQYGFDEAAGNFQSNNQGRGGAGNDYVLADAQDGSGTNNANFSTPADGSSGRMQMYLWNPIPTLLVNAPANIAGQYQAVESNFSTANKLITVGPKTGQVVYYNDNATASTTHEACAGVPVNSVLGKIALIDRGNCNFTVKVKNAQLAGAIGVIMVNNVQGNPITMGGTDNTITIPAVMISINDGYTIKNELANNVNVTMSVGQFIDGDVDNGVIAHEFSHGTSNRLTGGPAQASCLANAEQMGEGWSDYYGLMITQDWANSNLNSGFLSPRGIGTYVIGQLPNQLGIRTQRYCTDFDINNKIYAGTIPAQVHELGELWCATLWDMTWNIIQDVGAINPSIYDTSASGGNSIALKLVTEGMKLQPCSPGFIDGRNAILKADSLLYGGAHVCAIWEAFRRRGMGINASQGSSSSVTDQVADYTPLIKLVKNQSVDSVAEGQNITYTSVVSSCSPISNYVLRDTLPSNVTYVSGGTYDAVNRVVSFPVDFTTAQTQSFSFVVSVNSGSYFASQTLLDEQMTSTSLPASLTASSTTANTWTVSNTQSVSSPNSLFTPNAAIASDQKLETTNAINLGTGTSSLNFSHWYNTQAVNDGGIVELSSDNGTTWQDLTNKITAGYYNAIIASGSGNPIAGRNAWSGNSIQFIKSSVNLSSYTGQNIKLRFRFGSNNTTAGTGWYIDDILVKRAPVINVRTSLFNQSGTRVNYSDTVTRIIETVACTNVLLAAQPGDISACIGSNAIFNANVSGTNPIYQWQISTDAGTTYTNIPGATSATYTLTGVTAAMNGNRYRVVVTNNCPSSVTSSSALLTTNVPASITAQPNSTTLCVGADAIFSVSADGTGNTYQWQMSTDGGLNFTNITGATAPTYSISNVSASMSGNQYRVVISSCSPSALNSNAATLTVSNQASIAAQPSNVAACNGGVAQFSVSATGSSINYQWQVSSDGGATWNNINGANTSTLVLNTVSNSMNNNRYRVIITNNCSSSATSDAGVLIVSDPASLTAQPVDNTVCEGANVSFSVSATGSNTTYQWQVSTDGGSSFSNISGATAPTYSISNVTSTLSNNRYRAVVFSCSSTGVNSDVALLIVNSLAAITTPPSNVIACAGNNAIFTASATGSNIAYQWQISTDGGLTFSDIAGANASSFTEMNVTPAMNNNRYRVIVNNNCPSSATSSEAVLTVTSNAVINSQPQSVGVCPGGSAGFTVNASGPNISYQWQISTDGGNSFSNINGATSSTYQIATVNGGMNNNQYQALVYSSCSAQPSVSNSAVLNVLPEASVQTAPADVNGCDGSNVSFNANVTGVNVSYQWQVSSDGGNTFTNINGAITGTLTLNNITTGMNNNRYRVVATASPCGVTSTSARLSVLPSPVVTLTASPSTSLFPGLLTTLTATAIPASNSFSWYKNGNIISGVSSNSILVNYGERGAYTAKSLNGCDNISNSINITDSASSQLFIYPNPNDGVFTVQYYAGNSPTKRLLSIFDAKGSRVFSKAYTISGYEKMEVFVRNLAAGNYLVVLTDENGEKIATGKVVKR